MPVRTALSPLFLGVALLIQGCTFGISTPVKETKTSLELQALQVREFGCQKQETLGAVISVFQDLGYVIESTESAAGLVVAKTPSKAGWEFGRGAVTRWAKATGFVEPMGADKSKVRLSFVNSEQVDGYGMMSVNDARIEDPKVYQEAFTLLQKAIFLRKGIQ